MNFQRAKWMGKTLPPVKLTWYDGGLMPPKPVEMGDEELDKGGGAVLIGSKGKLLHETYGLNPRLLPKSLHDSFGEPAKKLPRIPGQQNMNELGGCGRRSRSPRARLNTRRG